MDTIQEANEYIESLMETVDAEAEELLEWCGACDGDVDLSNYGGASRTSIYEN